MFYADDMALLVNVYNELLNEIPKCKQEPRVCFDINPRHAHYIAISSRRWILDKAINRCLDNLQKDPMDILNDMLLDISISEMQMVTSDAKIAFGQAKKELQEIISLVDYRKRGGRSDY